MTRETKTEGPVTTMREAVADIAKRVLGIETLTTRKSDELDFHDVAVWNLAQALYESYIAGMNAAQKEGK